MVMGCKAVSGEQVRHLPDSSTVHAPMQLRPHGGSSCASRPVLLGQILSLHQVLQSTGGSRLSFLPEGGLDLNHQRDDERVNAHAAHQLRSPTSDKETVRVVIITSGCTLRWICSATAASSAKRCRAEGAGGWMRASSW